MPMLDEYSHLRAADEHLRIAVRLISAQEDRVTRGKAAGLDTELSEELLCTMCGILRSFVAHRNAICRAIQAEGYSPFSRCVRGPSLPPIQSTNA
ncbi:hypothetical protein [Burkholderia anthinoferrum]|uniref:hypothetical protein n=1 Tax=Burkholderia anthinoferrum TaxID=3090833 RepID=UPI000CE1C54B|nr:hypothetical protein [Burkholderia anthinoferrum]